MAQIANTVAASNGLTLINAPDASGITLQRTTQNRETDLQFLRRLANTYDYDFSIRGSQLVFYLRSSLETAAPVVLLDRTDTIRFSFKSKTEHVYNSARVSYQNPATKQLYTATVMDSDNLTGDLLDIQERAESQTDAQAKAAAALHLQNMSQSILAFTLAGNVNLVAGVVVTVGPGFGSFAGNYLITKSRHRLDRSSAYTTEIEARAIA